MRISPKCGFFIIFVLTAVVASCTSTKTVSVWKDDSVHHRLGKVLVIAVAELGFMQRHFEDVLANSLESHGIEAITANKFFPQSGANVKREEIESRVRELGVANVLVARVVGSEEAFRLYHGEVYVAPTNFYEGWYSQSVAGTAYDVDFFTVVTNIYDVRGEKLVWYSLSRVKVENSREGAINPLIDLLMKQLERSGML